MPLVFLCSGYKSLSLTFHSHSPAWLNPPGSKVSDEPAQDCPGLPLEIKAMDTSNWPIIKMHGHALHLCFINFAHGITERLRMGLM